MLYSFDTKHAEEYGLDEAVMLHNILYWLAYNKANGKNIHDGDVWTFNSAVAFSKLFPFWNSRKIARILMSLEKRGVIVSGNYNKKAYDKTKWYSSPLLDSYTKFVQSNDQICPMDTPDLSNRMTNSVQPIPDGKPNKKPNKTINCHDEEDFFAYGVDLRTIRQTTLEGKKRTREQLELVARLQANGDKYIT